MSAEDWRTPTPPQGRTCPIHGGPLPCTPCRRNVAPMPPGWIEQTAAQIAAGRDRLENPKETRR